MGTPGVALEPLLATALVTYRGISAQQLNYEKGELLEIQRDLGDGLVSAANLSQGGISGSVALKNVELNRQTSYLEESQLAMEELFQLRQELELVTLRREQMQSEVSELRFKKNELENLVKPVIFSLRQVSEVVLHLIETDMELVALNDVIRDFQNDWAATVAEINKLQAATDDLELEPFRSLVADRMESLKKRVVAMQNPTTDTIRACKLLHLDLENLRCALCGLPLTPRTSSTDSIESNRSTVMGGSRDTIQSTSNVTGNYTGRSSPILAYAGGSSTKPDPILLSGNALTGSLSTFFISTPQATDQDGPPSTLNSPSSSNRPTSPNPSGQGSNDLPINTRTTTGFNSPTPKYSDRGGFLGGQRLRANSPAIGVAREATAHQANQSSPSTSNTNSPGRSGTGSGSTGSSWTTKPSYKSTNE